MIFVNPFSQLYEFLPEYTMQFFVILMIMMVILGTLLDIIHKKNVKYFFENIKKSKKNATRTLNTSEKATIVVKTVSVDILTTSELNGKRRVAHILGMYGTIIFWLTSVIMIFCYSTIFTTIPIIYPILWHLGSLMTVIGGCWFWFFLRVDVSAEAFPWYRYTKADQFVLALILTQSSGFIWSFLQYYKISGLDTLFLILFILFNIMLFGGVYWSKFAHMFYKPGAALQKNFAEADGSRDNLPEPVDKPKQFGKGISREAPRHY
tara:strand:+ start:1811 stop:2602 length:792 start_codon:yes stop_codon:yes gene_type:complete